MYIVLYSEDPYLLARMATDLQMEGWKNDKWNNYVNPFYESYFIKYVEIEERKFCFHTHDCEYSRNKFAGSLITLTESNYLQTLSTILKNKK